MPLSSEDWMMPSPGTRFAPFKGVRLKAAHFETRKLAASSYDE